MIKVFCDECHTELTAEEVRYSLDMIGRALCSKHAGEYNNQKEYHWKYEKRYDGLKDDLTKWNKSIRNKYGNTPIICNHCHRESGFTQEGLMFYVVYHPLRCKHCGEVVVNPPSPTFIQP